MSCAALEMRSDAENDIKTQVGAAADDDTRVYETEPDVPPVTFNHCGRVQFVELFFFPDHRQMYMAMHKMAAYESFTA